MSFGEISQQKQQQKVIKRYNIKLQNNNKMGNIERKIFSPNNNGDNPSTRSQEHNNSNTSQQISGFNPIKQSLLQLTISDPIEHEQIMSNISLYSEENGVSASISQLKEYYKVKKEGYCTNQYVFYLVFKGCGCCGLKDEFGVRKMMGKKFQDQEIIALMKTYLAGVLVYVKEFKRKIYKIDLDDIGFQAISFAHEEVSHMNQPNPQNQVLWAQNSLSTDKKCPVRMYFIDPWLKQRRQQQIMSVNEVNVLLQNPSPQRLDQSYNLYNQFNGNKTQKEQTYGQKGGSRSNNNKNNKQSEGHSKKLHSLLFSIGVIGLKMLEMGFVDDIYVKLPQKKVNFERVEQYIEKHNHSNTQNRENHPNSLGSNEKHNHSNTQNRENSIGSNEKHSFSNSPNRGNFLDSNPYTNGYKSNGANNHHEKYTTTTSSMLRQKLVAGLKILLLSSSPKDREKIYDFWNVNLNETNMLNEISLENGFHLQPSSQQFTQSSQIPPSNLRRTVPNNQRQNTDSYQVIKPDQVNPFQNKTQNIAGNQLLNHNNNKNQDFVHRHKLYSIDETISKNHHAINFNTFSKNRNDLNANSHQYVYKVDQFRHHHPQQKTINPQHVINYHKAVYEQGHQGINQHVHKGMHEQVHEGANQQAHQGRNQQAHQGVYQSIQTQKHPQTSLSPQKPQIPTHQQRSLPTKINSYSHSTQNYYPYFHEPKFEQYSGASINIDGKVVLPGQIPQKAYFSGLEYKLPQKSIN